MINLARRDQAEIARAVAAFPPVMKVGQRNCVNARFVAQHRSPKRLFGEGAIPLGFRLVDTQQTTTGAVLHVYERVGTLKYGEVEVGQETVICRLGRVRIFQMPGSRLRMRAARTSSASRRSLADLTLSSRQIDVLRRG